MAHDVFVSYPHAGKPVADAVVNTLESRGVRCWVAPRDVPPGADWAGSIMGAIAESSAVVLVFSSSTNDSEHILREVRAASDAGGVIIPFRTTEVDPSPSLQYYLGGTHWLDALTEPIEAHLEVLAARITKMLGVDHDESPAGMPGERGVTSPTAVVRRRDGGVRVPRWALASGAALALVVVAGIWMGTRSDGDGGDVSVETGTEQPDASTDKPDATVQEAGGAADEHDDGESTTGEPDTVSEPAADDEGTIVRVSVASDGTESNDHSANPSISADGRWVAFDSLASNLVEGDRDAHRDVFVHDRDTGETTQIVAADGQILNGASHHPRISADGRFVAFVSEATNVDLDVDDTNDASDIYVYDRQLDERILISRAPNGTQHEFNSIDPSMSDDGMLIAYATYAQDERPSAGQGSGVYAAWIYAAFRGTTTRLADFDTSDPGVDLSPPIVARSGALVAVGGLHAGVFVYEAANGEVNEIPDLRGVAWPLLWGEGEHYYFTSCDDLLLVDDDDVCDIFTWHSGRQEFRVLRDLDRHFRVAAVTSDERFVLIAGPDEGGFLVVDQIDETSFEFAQDSRAHSFDLSGDGRYVTFSSPSPGLVEDDTNIKEDVFVIQLGY